MSAYKQKFVEMGNLEAIMVTQLISGRNRGHVTFKKGGSRTGLGVEEKWIHEYHCICACKLPLRSNVVERNPIALCEDKQADQQANKRNSVINLNIDSYIPPGPSAMKKGSKIKSV